MKQSEIGASSDTGFRHRCLDGVSLAEVHSGRAGARVTWPRSVRKHLFTEAMDADQLFVDIWAGHRVDRKQFLTRRQALVVNVLRVEFDLNLFVQSVQVQLQTVQRVPAINTQYILPCKQLDGGTRQSANSRCWQLGHLQYVFALCDLDLWHFDLILNG